MPKDGHNIASQIPSPHSPLTPQQEKNLLSAQRALVDTETLAALLREYIDELHAEIKDTRQSGKSDG